MQPVLEDWKQTVSKNVSFYFSLKVTVPLQDGRIFHPINFWIFKIFIYLDSTRSYQQFLIISRNVSKTLDIETQILMLKFEYYIFQITIKNTKFKKREFYRRGEAF